MSSSLHLAPDSPLRRASRGPGDGELRHVARFLGLLYIAGASLGVVSLLLPHDPADVQALTAIIAGAYCVGAPLTVLYRHVPIWASHAIIALAAAMVSLAVYYSGEPGSVYALMLVWSVLLTAYFFRKREVALHLVWILVCYGVALAELDHHGQHFAPITRWLLTAIALIVAAVLTSRLATRRREAELASRHLAAIVDSSQDAVISVSLDGAITSWNEGAERLYGYSYEEAIGQPGSMLAPPGREDEISAILSRVVDGQLVDHYETLRRRRDGSLVDVSLAVSPICDDDGHVVGASAAARDITARRRLEMDHAQLLAQVRAVARTDPLTALANRRAWDDELKRELARASRRESPMAVAMLDIDRFKRFNDTHGHPAGDELLKTAAENWRLQLRNTDFIARYGGEEFAVLLSDCSPRRRRKPLSGCGARSPGASPARSGWPSGTGWSPGR